MIVVCLGGIAGNLFYILAMKHVSPSKANVFRSFEIMLNYGFQIWLQGDVFHWSAVAGIGLLVAAVLLNAGEERLKKRVVANSSVVKFW